MLQPPSPPSPPIMLVGTLENEKAMMKASLRDGTFIIRPSLQGECKLTLCVMHMHQADGKWVQRKHNIAFAKDEEGNKTSYKLMRSDPANDETFPSLKELLISKWDHLKLKRNFLGDKSYDDMFGSRDNSEQEDGQTSEGVLIPFTFIFEE